MSSHNSELNNESFEFLNIDDKSINNVIIHPEIPVLNNPKEENIDTSQGESSNSQGGESLDFQKELDDYNPDIVTNGPIIKSSDKKYAQKLLDNIETFKDIINIEEFKTSLEKIINHVSDIKYRDPTVRCYYEYDGRCGNFKASGYPLLSEYITATVCLVDFHFSDVLGKHSELEFKVDELTYEYVEEEESDSNYELFSDYPRTPYADEIYDKVLDYLRKYMSTLEPLTLEEFKNKREDDLMSYAKKYLNSLIKTNNPMIQVNGSNYNCFTTPLSNYLANRLTTPNDIVFEKDSFSFSGRDITWKTAEIKPIAGNGWESRYDVSISYPELENKILAILKEFPSLPPIEFFKIYFDQIKTKLDL